ncbi:MAG: cupredoxin domain-containing protein [Candidatus Nanoarchaeia archaeon]|nr:cupredoxin domain-containing protein [Candidatus Nanoarchaeia archaeon]
MKKSSLILILVLFLLVGCKPSGPKLGSEEVTQQMPAPGFEDIPEMVVNEENMPPVDDFEPAEIAPGELGVDISSVFELNVAMRQFEFDPNPISVTLGSNVRLILTAEDVEHGFAINEYNINEKVKPGEPKTIEFIADKKGEFEIRCSVVCGSGHGSMRGTLIVE